MIISAPSNSSTHENTQAKKFGGKADRRMTLIICPMSVLSNWTVCVKINIGTRFQFSFSIYSVYKVVLCVFNGINICFKEKYLVEEII